LKKKIIYDKSKILYFSSYPPRECGIATFTKDLTMAMDKKFNPRLKSKILAINDNGSSIYNYGKNVVMQIDESDIEQYIDIAEKINKNNKIKLVNIQHEFGIFGGEKGEFLIPFLEKLEKPVVITFHSLIPKPNKERLKLVKALAKRSNAVVVMANHAVEILKNKYELKSDKIYMIHHGVPLIYFLKDNSEIKKLLNLKNKIIISTFGLINRGKGIEYVIKALPNLVKKYPNLLFLIIGETHPNVRREEGELYRNGLVSLVKKLGLKNHVKFYNKYLSLSEIISYLKATDVYVYSALDVNQIVSGTLAYAMGAGKAIVATPSLYANEMMKNKRGIIVKLKNSESMTSAIEKILSDKKLKESLERNVYRFSRRMIWQNVAAKYLDVFKKIIDVNEKIGMSKLPKLKLGHLINMTDDTGIIQHAKHSLPNRFSGYSIDDNARALIVATKYYNKFQSNKSLELINTYLGFLYHCKVKDTYFHNFMSYDKKFLDKKGSEDCFGRTLWATGFLVNSKVDKNLKASAKFIFDNAVKNVDNLRSVRARAFSIIGLYYYYNVYKNENILEKIKRLADKLVESYRINSDKEWKWFEKVITYSNGKLPEALFLAYKVGKEKKYLEVAEESLNFLSSLLILNNKLVLIGHNGWFNFGGKRSYYDQQPVDASSMVQVYVSAFKVTKKEEYYDKAFLAYSWFLGNNSINQVVYDELSGGCYDGLRPSCINLNQGAESTICHLLARLSLEDLSLLK